MPQLSTVDIAQRQRHMHLLQRIKSGKTLTPVEITELGKYETKLATGKISKKQKPEKTAAAGRTKITPPVVKAWASQYITMAACERAEGLKFGLGGMLKQKKTLDAAWRRGQLLRKLAEFGAGNASISQIEADLKMETGQLESLFAADAEAAEAFNNTRIATIALIQRRIVEKVTGGEITVTALRQIEAMLRREVAKKGADFEHVPLETMVELAGVSRQTIHSWWSRNGMPKNSDGTYNLRQFLPWFEKYTVEKVRPSAAKDTNTYQDEKTRRMRAQNDEYLGNLLRRDNVLAGWIGRYRQIILTLDRRAGELPLLLANQSAERISPVLTDIFSQIRKNLCEIPPELKLPPAAAAKFAEVLKMISDTEDAENKSGKIDNRQ